MTLFGHGSVSYIAARAAPITILPACIIGGMSPDIDFLFLFFPFFNSIHRVVTHNVFFVMLMASIVCCFFKQERMKAWICAGGCGIIHLMVDSMLDQNPTNGLGVALFWPLSDWMFSPVNLVSVDPHSEGWNNLSRSFYKMWVIVMYEIPFYVFAAWLWFRQKRSMPVAQLKGGSID